MSSHIFVLIYLKIKLNLPILIQAGA